MTLVPVAAIHMVADGYCDLP